MFEGAESYSFSQYKYLTDILASDYCNGFHRFQLFKHRLNVIGSVLAHKGNFLALATSVKKRTVLSYEINV